LRVKYHLTPGPISRNPPLPYGLPASHRTMVPSHFNATPTNIPTRAVQGRRRYARARRRFSILTASRALATFSGGGSWAEPLWKTAHRRIPTEGVSIKGFAFLIPASSACARSLLVPGTCDLTRRRTDTFDSAAPCAWKGPNIPAPRTASSLGPVGGPRESVLIF
jgi:hypothetical protein